MTSDATKRNVQATGSNALYTKPGTVKGAKVVASKATMAKLADSKKSANYFRAYGVKTTNRGSVYYRVVTMDGKYRGYVYGGKSDTAFAGGIVSAETTKTATNPTKLQNYYLKDVSKNTLWTAPKYTQYKASKVNLYGAKSTDPFKVDQAATKTQEGSLYYHVTDVNNSAISGWIYAGKGYSATATTQDLGGLSLNISDAAATSDNSVKVVYRDATSKAQVGSATWISNATTAKAGATVGATDANNANVKLADFVTNSLPSGYTVSGTPATATAQYGNTLYVDVTAAATSKVALVVNAADVNNSAAGDATLTGALSTTGTNTLTKSDLSLSLSSDAIKALSGAKGTTFSTTDLGTVNDGLAAISIPINGSKVITDSEGTSYYYEYTYTTDSLKTNNTNKNYGDTLTANFTAKLVKGTPTTSSSDSSWIA